MLRSLCSFSIACVLLLPTGCALRHYDVTLTNGNVIGAKGKPRLESGYYVFTDMTGKQQSLPQYRVSEVAPHVEKTKKSPFNNYGFQQ